MKGIGGRREKVLIHEVLCLLYLRLLGLFTLLVVTDGEYCVFLSGNLLKREREGGLLAGGPCRIPFLLSIYGGVQVYILPFRIDFLSFPNHKKILLLYSVTSHFFHFTICCP